MDHLRKEGCVFSRNLKPQNILLKKNSPTNPDVFIADIGTQAILEKSNEKEFETAYWMSPEKADLLEKTSKESSGFIDECKSDIFSLGLIILYCIDTNRFLKFHDKFGRIRLNNSEKNLNKYLNLLRRELRPSFWVLLRNILSYSPEKRDSFENFLKNIEFFNSKGDWSSRLSARWLIIKNF